MATVSKPSVKETLWTRTFNESQRKMLQGEDNQAFMTVSMILLAVVATATAAMALTVFLAS